VVVNRFDRTACVFQSPRLLPWRTTRENLAFGLKARGIGAKTRRAPVDALLARLGLTAAADRYPRELSGGMRQRAALGRALAVEPQLLLMDEPFTALDVGLRRGLQDLVRELLRERGMAAILVTHDLAEALRMADELAVMASSPGRIVYRGREYLARDALDESEVHRRVAALLERPGVAEAFFGDANQTTNRPLAGLESGRN
jgi:NitT/TauT family transport system ATP-binding protein